MDNKSTNDILYFFKDKDTTNKYIDCCDIFIGNPPYDLILHTINRLIQKDKSFITSLALENLRNINFRQLFSKEQLSQLTIIIPYERIKLNVDKGKRFVFLGWKIARQSLILQTQRMESFFQVEITSVNAVDMMKHRLKLYDNNSFSPTIINSVKEMPFRDYRDVRDVDLKLAENPDAKLSDEYYSKKEHWTTIRQIFRKFSQNFKRETGQLPIVFQGFYGDGHGAEILKQNIQTQHSAGDFKDVIGSKQVRWGQDSFLSYYDRSDILISNPPFSIKARILHDLVRLGKPFVLILPADFLCTQTFKRCFNNDQKLINKLIIIFPYGSTLFLDPTKGLSTKVSDSRIVDIVYVCWGLGLYTRSTALFAPLPKRENAKKRIVPNWNDQLHQYMIQQYPQQQVSMRTTSYGGVKRLLSQQQNSSDKSKKPKSQQQQNSSYKSKKPKSQSQQQQQQNSSYKSKKPKSQSQSQQQIQILSEM
jgi:hypothetical protein